MTSERWRQLEEVFDAAAQLGREQRAAYLDQACGDDRELRREVESMLAVDGHAPELLRAGIEMEAERLSAGVSASVIGQRIGSYRITDVLGRGGMGAVYLATREDDVYEKPVALKVVKRGMDTDDVIRRFRQERRILSRLDHPYIGRLLDGGATGDGRPYFVMEYVEGDLVTVHARTLALPDRLKLFRQVCEAVEYAHRNLVVHRDLKPGNVLVTAAGTPKLLDFGIAKLLTPEETGQTLADMRILTPGFASPEQKRGEPVTTASDVYSLGRVLEEVLRDTAAAGDLRQIVEMARHEDADRRYASVAQLSDDVRRYLEGLPVVARKDTLAYRSAKFLRRNQWAAAAVALAVAGLFTTTTAAVWQAWEAEQQRQSAEVAKAAAVEQAHRADEARAQALAESGRADQARGEAVAQARRADTARAAADRQAQRSRDFAAQVAANLNRRLNQLTGALQARHELAQATLAYTQRLSQDHPSDPQIQYSLARAYLTTAMVHYHIGNNSFHRFDTALADLEKGRAIILQLRRKDPGNLEYKALEVGLFRQTGLTLSGMGRAPEALEVFRRNLPLAEQVGSAPIRGMNYGNGGTEAVYGEIAHELMELGDYRGALKILPRGSSGIPVAQAALGDLHGAWRTLSPRVQRLPAHRNTYVGTAGPIRDKRELAAIAGHPLRLNLGDTETALLLTRQNIEVASAMLASEPADGSSRWILALQHDALGALLRETKPEESVSAYRRAIALWKELLDRSPGYLTTQRRLAAAHAGMALPLRKLGRADHAREALTTARALENRVGEPRSFTRRELGDLDLEAGHPAQALEHYQAALQLAGQRVADRPQDMQARRELADTHEKLAAFYESSGERQQALAWYGRSLAVWRDWTQYGVSSIYNERREKLAAAAVARLAD